MRGSRPVAAEQADEPLRAPSRKESTESPSLRERNLSTDNPQTVAPQSSVRAAAAPTATSAATPGDVVSSASRGLDNLQQVLETVKTRARIIKTDGVIKAQVPLKPEGLGAMQMEVIKRNGRYRVRFGVESADAARAVERALPQLREQLAAAGIQVDKAEVEVGTLRDTQDADTPDRDSRNLRRDRADGDRAGNRERGRGDASGGERAARAREEERTPDRGGRRPLDTGTNTVDYVY